MMVKCYLEFDPRDYKDESDVIKVFLNHFKEIYGHEPLPWKFKMDKVILNSELYFIEGLIAINNI